MQQYPVSSIKCPQHQFPIQSICCSNHCNLMNICCKMCVQEHQSHYANVMKIQKLQNAILSTLEQQNRLDVNTLKQNDSLIFKINKYRKDYNQEEQTILEKIITLFEQEKNQITKLLNEQSQLSIKKNQKYLQRLSRNKLMLMRIKFASQKGLNFFNICSHNLNKQESSVLPAINIPNTQKSITNILASFIKLRISKKDAMKISTGFQSENQVQTPTLCALPPSPKKKRKKSNLCL